MKRFIFMALFLFSFSIYGAGFRIEGEDLEDFQLIFETFEVDFSNPESVLKGLLDCKMALTEDKRLYLRARRMELKTAEKLFEPIMTQNMFSSFFSATEKNLDEIEKNLEKSQFSYSVTITDKNKQEKKIELFFTVHTKAFSLKGRKRSQKYQGKIVLVLEEEKWKVQELYRQGWKNKYREDRFLQGPTFFENLPALQSLDADLSHPNKAFHSFIAACKKYQLLRRVYNNNCMCEAFKQFIKFFGCKKLHKKLKKSSSYKDKNQYGIAKTEMKKKSAVVFFKFLGSSRYMKKQSFKIELVKDENKWLIDAYYAKYSPRAKWRKRRYLPY